MSCLERLLIKLIAVKVSLIIAYGDAVTLLLVGQMR